MTNLQLHPPQSFEAVLETDRRLQLSGIDREELASQVVQTLVQTQPFESAWEAEYRTIYLLSGASGHSVTTLEEVQAIPVPQWRRVRGVLDGNQLSLTEMSVSDDGQDWRPYPVFSDLRQEELHPAFNLPGKVVGQFTTLHWREGRIDIEPDPPADVLELLEGVVQAMNGDGDAAWAAQHGQFGGPANVKPEAKRGTIEVRELAPLFSPSMPPFARQGRLEFWPLVPLEYSLDGKKWLKYPLGGEVDDLPASSASAAQNEQTAALAALLGGRTSDDSDDDDGEDPFGMLSSLFDLQTASVTAYADGRVEWPEGDIPAEHAEALRHSILQATGAGNAEVWQARTAELLPEGETGQVQALQLQVMKQLLDAAPGMLEQSFAPTALSLDGTNWLDITPPFMLDDEDEEE